MSDPGAPEAEPAFSVPDSTTMDLDRWSFKLVKRYRVALIRNIGEFGQTTGLISSPSDSARKSILEGRIGSAIDWRECSDTDFDAFLDREESTRLVADSGILDAFPSESRGHDDDDEILSLEAVDDSSSPVVRAVNASLYDGLRLRASDVHFESTQHGLQVRYRLDGVLVPGTLYRGRHLSDMILSRIKVMSHLDIAERRIPQDGRFSGKDSKRRIDFRVSVMPSSYGEDAVIRILDKQQIIQDLGTLSLSALGLSERNQNSLKRLASMPHGMLLVTGPTGSGKTTTLYALLNEVMSDREKLITIEDPIEYQLTGVLQIPVNERKGLTFAKGLRSILRHDPDRIMVGEIRDAETAEIAIQSALTGHTVFTTVHANNIFDVVGRFAYMNIDLSNFVTALNGIVAQRLIRLLCPVCSIPDSSVQVVSAESELGCKDETNWTLMRAIGCSQCNYTGYRGRMAIAEQLVLDDEVRQCIRDREAPAILKNHARRLGFTSLRNDALRLAANGRTTLEECNRVSMAD